VGWPWSLALMLTGLGAAHAGLVPSKLGLDNLGRGPGCSLLSLDLRLLLRRQSAALAALNSAVCWCRPLAPAARVPASPR